MKIIPIPNNSRHGRLLLMSTMTMMNYSRHNPSKWIGIELGLMIDYPLPYMALHHLPPLRREEEEEEELSGVEVRVSGTTTLIITLSRQRRFNHLEDDGHDKLRMTKVKLWLSHCCSRNGWGIPHGLLCQLHPLQLPQPGWVVAMAEAAAVVATPKLQRRKRVIRNQESIVNQRLFPVWVTTAEVALVLEGCISIGHQSVLIVGRECNPWRGSVPLRKVL